MDSLLEWWGVFTAWTGLDSQEMLFAAAAALWGLRRLLGMTVRSGFQGLKFSFGRASAVLEPGFYPLIPWLQVVVAAPTRSRTLDLPTQRVRNADGLVFEVNANVTYRVEDLKASLIEVSNLETGLLDLLAVCVQQIVDGANQTAMADLRGFDDALHARLQESVRAWGVRVEQVGFTTVTPVGHSLTVTQLWALMGERARTLKRLEGAGLHRSRALALLGARSRFITRTRVLRARETASRRRK